jgi:protein ImuB
MSVVAEGGVRTLVVWCPDWPVVAAGVPAATPAAVLVANRVVACSAAARAEGVRRGLRRREAQARCPDLALLAAEPQRDGRAFEAVAAAVEAITPRVEVVRPGTLAFPTRGPVRLAGGEPGLVAQVAVAVRAVLPEGAEVAVGVADGLFAALLAARRKAVVPAGESAAFLAPWPVGALDRAPEDPAATAAELTELAGLLRRLGLRTLGAVAAVPVADLAGRFGPAGVRVGRLARGLDERPPLLREVPEDLVACLALDPPAERVETAAFAARTLAAELDERLGRRGLVCARVSIEAETEHGESLARLWRHAGGLGPAALVDRVRWQLDGWLNRSWSGRPTGGISLLRLVPDQLVPADGRQLGFWGGTRAADERAARGVARLQGLLGPDAVLVPERRGGRGPGERSGLVPAHTVRLGDEVAAGPGADPAAGPWPGRLPAPSPAVVHPAPLPAEVHDVDGRAVTVTARGLAGEDPACVSVNGGPWAEVVTWAGPWPFDERWWDPDAHRRRARIQVVTADGAAHLLVREAGRWAVEATYD